MSAYQIGEKIATLAAGHLLQHGYASIPYDDSNARELATRFRKFLMNKPCPQERLRWCRRIYRKDGALEPNFGYLPLASGKDAKHCFHYEPGLKIWLMHKEVDITKCDHTFLELCAAEYLQHRRVVFEVAEALGRVFGKRFLFTEEINAAKDSRNPSVSAILRLLHYPPQQKSEVARVHFDKSMLTLHVGGDNGQLIGRKEFGPEFNMTPEEGRAVIFFGAKANCVALRHGLPPLKPIAHRVEAPLRCIRAATVSFWHSTDEMDDAPKVPY